MKTIIALCALPLLLAADDQVPAKHKTVALEPWGAGHAAPDGKVYYDFTVTEDGRNPVQLKLRIINNTGHFIAISKKSLEMWFLVEFIDAEENILNSLPGSGYGSTGPEEFMVFNTQVRGDGRYCALSTVATKTRKIDRAVFDACSRIKIATGLSGFLDNMREPVDFQIDAGFDRKAKDTKKAPPPCCD